MNCWRIWTRSEIPLRLNTEKLSVKFTIIQSLKTLRRNRPGIVRDPTEHERRMLRGGRGLHLIKSTHGFVSILGSKEGKKITSAKNAAGERGYKISKCRHAITRSTTLGPRFDTSRADARVFKNKPSRAGVHAESLKWPRIDGFD